MVKRIPIPRAYVRESDPEVLKQFLKKVPKEKRVRVKKPYVPKRVYRRYSDTQRLLVVGLRYGSLTDFSKIRLSWT